MAEPILEVIDLYKNFGSVNAVNGLSFSILPGRCFGLLGPNGAGKTTTIEIVEGIQSATSGRVLYKGQPLGKRFRNEVGVQLQVANLQDFLTVKEILELYTKLYPKAVPLDQIIELCSLQEFLGRDNRKLSGGQRQRLLLALALINDPEIIFLDEPTTGLDPHSRQNFWQLINAIKAQGKTLVLTTHYMEEAYTLCDEISIVDYGKIIARGSPKSLLDEHFQGKQLSLPSGDINVSKSHLPTPYREVSGRVEFDTTEVNKVLGQLLELDIPLNNLEIRSPTLDDLFLKLTGHGVRR